MSDGANLGVTADRALKTIFGKEPSPDESESQTRDETLARITAAPDPLEGPPIWEREGDSYSLAADCIAKAFLLVTRDDPGLLHQHAVYTEELIKSSDARTRELLLGQPRHTSDVLWDDVSGRWPGFDEWIGGASGFQVGFALNTARFVMGKPTGGNPAIVEIGGPR